VKDLKDRAAWITGGASGIGLALARRFASEGMKLVLVDVEAGPLAEAEKALREQGASVLAIRADVSNLDEMSAAVAKARDAFGVMHVICNNAGVGGGGGPMWSLTDQDWRWTIDVNLWGVIHGIRLLLPALIESGQEGHVVNTASMAGLTSTPFLGPYTATKHAVVALSECLFKELDLVKAKVGVSVLCPGFVKTKIASSQRNRPGGTKQPGNPHEARFGGVFQQLVDAGIPAEKIAEEVLRSIREDRFYVLTHPEMKPQIEYRMQQILEEKQPGIDPLIRSLFGGG
jgi:NAD(P)-dependent dehydrogenase (short-subunit alcohol dehydrogenase family)